MYLGDQEVEYINNMFKIHILKIINCQIIPDNMEYTYLCTAFASNKQSQNFFPNFSTATSSFSEFTNCSFLHLAFLFTF